MNSFRNSKFLLTVMALGNINIISSAAPAISADRMTVPQLFTATSKATYTSTREYGNFSTFDNSWQLPTTGVGSIYFTANSPGVRVNDIYLLFSPVLGKSGSSEAIGGVDASNFSVIFSGWGGSGWGTMSAIRNGLLQSSSLYIWPKNTGGQRVIATQLVPFGRQGSRPDNNQANLPWLQPNQPLNFLILYRAIGEGERDFSLYVQKPGSANNLWELALVYNDASPGFNLPATAKYFSLSTYANVLEYSNIRVGSHPIQYIDNLQAADQAVTNLIFALCSTNPTTAANAYAQATTPTSVEGSSTLVPYYQTLTKNLQQANDALYAFRGDVIKPDTYNRYPRPTTPTGSTLPENVKLSVSLYVDPSVKAEHPDIAALNTVVTSPALKATIISNEQQLAQTLQTVDNQVIQLITELVNPATRSAAQENALTLGAPTGITNSAFDATIPYFKNLIAALQTANDALKPRPIAQAVASAFSRPVITTTRIADSKRGELQERKTQFSDIIASISSTLFNAAVAHPDGIALKQAVDLALALTLQQADAAVTAVTAQLYDPEQQVTAHASVISPSPENPQQTYGQYLIDRLQNANNKLANYPEAQALATAAPGSTLYVEGADKQPSLFASTASRHPDAVALGDAGAYATGVIVATNTALAKGLQEADANVITLLQQITNPDTKVAALASANTPNANGIKRYLSLAEALQNANNALTGNAAAIAIANGFPRTPPTIPNVTLAKSLYVDSSATPQHPDAAALINIVTNALASGIQPIPTLPAEAPVEAPLTDAPAETDIVIEASEPAASTDGTIDL